MTPRSPMEVSLRFGETHGLYLQERIVGRSRMLTRNKQATSRLSRSFMSGWSVYSSTLRKVAELSSEMSMNFY
jgi:hypothetical protein